MAGFILAKKGVLDKKTQKASEPSSVLHAKLTSPPAANQPTECVALHALAVVCQSCVFLIAAEIERTMDYPYILCYRYDMLYGRSFLLELHVPSQAFSKVRISPPFASYSNQRL